MKQSKQLSIQIRDFLITYYSQYSFNVEQKFSGFSKNTERFKQSVFLGATREYSSSVVYTPGFSISNFEIQSIKDKILGEDSRFKNFTIKASQGEKLAQGYNVVGYEGWTMYDIKGESDIQPMIEHHKEFMEKVGWQFLEQTQTIEGINTYLNTPFVNIDTDGLSQDEKTKLIRHNGADWMVNGIITAWLVNSNDLEKLIENYRLIYFPDHIQKVLDQLLQYINNQAI